MYSTALFGGKMIVREVIAQVAKIAEDDSMYSKIVTQADSTDQKVKSKVNSLLDCYNSVIRSIALNYYEYIKSVEVPVETVTIATLDTPLLRLISIKDKQGKNLKYKIENGEIIVEKCPFILSYRAFPKEQSLDETYMFEKTPIGVNVVIYGTLAEYMLMQNRIDEAQNWDNKFRQSLDFRLDYKARKLKAGKSWGL